MQKLLADGADPNAAEPGPFPALYYAVVSTSPDLAVVRALLRFGADPNAKIGHDSTPLLGVAMAPDVLLLLLEAGADPKQVDDQGNSPLHCVHPVWPDCIGSAKLLLGTGADINARNLAGQTPLMALCADAVPGASALIQLLLGRGATLDAQDATGQTVLHLLKPMSFLDQESTACPEIADLLIAHGAQLGVRDRHGNTPGHAAAARGQRRLLEHMIRKGLDPTASNDQGKTANQILSDFEESIQADPLLKALPE